MPDLITNYLHTGQMENFIDLYGDEENNIAIDFQKIIPCPPHVYQGALSSVIEEKYGEYNCCYEWNKKNWDTKWNACETRKLKNNLIMFKTPWSAPYRIYEALSILHPLNIFTICIEDDDEDKFIKEYSFIDKLGRDIGVDEGRWLINFLEEETKRNERRDDRTQYTYYRAIP